MARSQLSQGGGESLYPGSDDGLGARIALEDPKAVGRQGSAKTCTNSGNSTTNSAWISFW